MKNFKKVLSLALAALMVIGGLVITPVDAQAAETFTQVTSLSEITNPGANEVFVFVAKFDGKYYALPTTISSKIAASIEVTVSGNTITGDDLPKWKLTAGDAANTVTISNGSENLGWKSGTDLNKESEKWLVEASEAETGTFRLISTESQAGTTVRALALQRNSSGTKIQFGGYAAINDTATSNEDNYGNAYQMDLMVFKGVGQASNAGTTTQYATTKELYDAVKALTANGALPGTHELEGVITEVNYLYSSSKKNITVTIDVDGYEFYCYNLSGTNCDKIDKGDTIKVSGTAAKYNDLVQIQDGTLVSYTAGTHPTPVAPTDSTPKAIVDALFALDNGKSLPGGPYTLTGKVTSIEKGYNNEKGTITVNIEVEGKTIQCYNLTGEGAKDIAENDVITVKGELKRYNKTYEFDAPVMVTDTGDSGNTGSGDTTTGGSTTTPNDKVDTNTGDMNTVGLYIVLFAGVALVAVSVLGKKKMA